jgi:UPF0755 protein
MKLFKLLLIICIVGPIALFAWIGNYAVTPLNLDSNHQEISIATNSSLRSIANQLVKQEVLPEAWRFILLAKVFKKESSLQSGEYVLNKNITPYQLLFSLNNGKTTQASITFIEGQTFAQMRAKLAKNSAVKQTISHLTEAEIMRQLDAHYQKAEGLFFPDTYYFDRNTSDIKLLKRSYDAMQTKLTTSWKNKANNLPYQTPYDALIMASIVEKETGKASERPMIAGVFMNRLRIGMLLQTDPTVIYGIGEKYDGNIRKTDLQTDTPYNTYTRSGLPPTPIAMPGLAAIEAALHPESTQALYFVGKGDGSHAFSESLKAHNNAVARYQLKSVSK